MTLTPCSEIDVYGFLIEQVYQPILRALSQAKARQRLRVSSLPKPVMDRICERLFTERRFTVRLLSAPPHSNPWEASDRKIIELRNTIEEPLLIFVPPGQRTASEDSLDIATFSELSLSSLPRQMDASLLERIPQPLREQVTNTLSILRREKKSRNRDQEIEYLLTVLKNGATNSAVGGALYVFGLIPDFQLCERSNLLFWLTRNSNAQKELADLRRPLRSRISRLPLQNGSIQDALFGFLRTRHSEDTRAWTREIACDAACHHLSLENWQFSESGDEKTVRLILEPLALPMQQKDPVGQAAQVPVLDLESKVKLKVSFRSVPSPAQAVSWHSFRIQILSSDTEEPSVVWESNNYPKPRGANRVVNRAIKREDLQAVEEGTYFVRVDAYDTNGAVLTVQNKIEAGGRHENESDLFLVVRGATEVEPIEPRAVNVPSLIDAWTAVCSRRPAKDVEQLPELEGVSGSWSESIGAAPRGEVHFCLEPTELSGYTVVVPAILRKLELALLENPARYGILQLNLEHLRQQTDAVIEHAGTLDLPATSALSAFSTARVRVFQQIREQHILRSKQPDEQAVRTSIVETADLIALATSIEEYARAYQMLVQSLAIDGAPQSSALWGALAQLDTVRLSWRRSLGDPGRALLLGPTHPVRLLWHLQHARLCHFAVKRFHDKQCEVPSWRRYFEQVRGGILPVNLPLVLFDYRQRPYVEQGPLTAFWSLYLPDRSSSDQPVDVATCRDTVRRLLGVRGRSGLTHVVPARHIAHRLLEYLLQHPYCEQFRINVFNPGDGDLVVEVLRELEMARQAIGPKDGAPALRYSVQMFGPSHHIDTMGSSLESLLDPDRQVKEDDEFTLLTTNHLFPKLVFARNTIEDFLKAPTRFAAHLSLFQEQFQIQGRIGIVNRLHRCSFVNGLVQESETLLETEGPTFGWLKAVRPEAPAGAAQDFHLFVQVLNSAHAAQAALATGKSPLPAAAPTVALHLDAAAQALLRNVHQVSDWVLTVDRNIGLDFFDRRGSVQDCGYLLDFAPAFLQEDRQRLLLTTRSAGELEALIRPAMEAHGISWQPRDEQLILEALRSVSGRLAMRLFSARGQGSEIVGVLLARWLLEEVNALTDSIIVPLDAHLGWFLNEEADDAIAQLLPTQRADLLIIRPSFAERRIRICIVEVKLRNDLSDSARLHLYEQMQQQAQSTEEQLRTLFDANRYSVPRADAELRAKELATVLSFYVKRAERYRLMTHPVADEALNFVLNLEDGYTLDISSCGILFHMHGTGSHLDEEEPGFPVHRFGLDRANQLLTSARQRWIPPGDNEDPSTPVAEPLPAAPSAPIVTDSAAVDPAAFDTFRSQLGGRSACLPKPTPVIQNAMVKAEGHLLPATQPAGPAPVVVQATSQPSVSGLADAGLRTNASPAPSKQSETKAQESTSHSAQPGMLPTTGPSTVPAAQRTPEPPSLARTDILLGATEPTLQYGILGRAGSARVSIDLMGCNTISLFGVQGFGKSYTLGVISEMASCPVQGINVLPSPLATIIFHYHKSDSYAPEYAAAVAPNQKLSEVDRLLAEYGARPSGVRDVVLLCPESKMAHRKSEFPGIEIRPIKFSSAEIGTDGWKFLLGAVGNDSLYVRQLVAIMRRLRGSLSISKLRQELISAGLQESSRRLAEDRITLAEPYIDDKARLQDVLRPGRTVIVDLRDEWIEKEEALGLFVVMMNIFAKSRFDGQEFNKLVVFDEAHKYITESDLIGQVVETIREMRHHATSVVIASQDPISLPRTVVELTTILVLHRITSPQWLKHLKGALSRLEDVTDAQLAALQPGEALVWAQRSTEQRFCSRPQKVNIRPRFSQHGGGTKTAVAGATIR